VLAAQFDAPMAADDAGARERALFDARRQALDAQLAALGAQRREARTRLQALEAQHAAADRAAALARDELAMQQELLAAGFVQRGRLIGFERAAHDALARVEAARGQVSEVQQQLAQLTGQEAQARSAYQQRAADELEDAGRRLRELDERLRPSEDQVGRQVVRAPADGTVMSLRVGAVGTAVGPRETLLEIAPSDETLVVEALVAPRDIDHVVAGGAAEVRLAPYDARRTAPLPALVAHVAPDAERDESGMAWYRARLEIGAEALAAQPGLRLQAGMPAEVFVSTAPRSLLAYLLEPLGLFAGRAMREP
jgi:HlyD family type I secretion membrane fusion protein